MFEKVFFVSLCFVCSFMNCKAQTNPVNSGFDKILSNSYAGSWKYFSFQDTMTGTVIMHNQQIIQCGDIATASITIIKAGMDTIRVIDICNTKSYKDGQKVRFFCSMIPEFSVCVPFFDTVDEKTNKIIYHSNKYDDVVLKTTWGFVRTAE